jgi:predicted Zn finger-like uncharacterized protein
MRIECDNCGAKYTISDEKIAGKQSRSRCKKCGHMMLVDGTHLAAPGGGAHDEATRVFDTNTGAAPDASEAETVSGWYIVLDGNQTGPMELDELSSHVQSGALDIDGFVWRDGMDDWVRLGDLPELAEALGFTGAEDEDAGGYVEEATRVVSVASEPEAPFSFAARPSALAESFQPAPAGPAATLREDFFNPAPVAAAPSVASMLAAPAPVSSPSAPVDGAGEFTGQRRENSVLFSLSDLTSSRSPTQKADAVPRTEGSGLIDIRLLAQSQATVGANSSEKSGDGAGLPPAAARPMVPIVPIPVRRSNTPLYVAIGVGSTLAVALLVVIFYVMNQPPVVVTAPTAVAEASAPVVPEVAVAPTVDAGQPSVEADTAVVVVAEPDVTDGSSDALAAEASAPAEPVAVAAAEPAAPNTRPAATPNAEAGAARPTAPAQADAPTREATPVRPSAPAQEEPAAPAEPATPPTRPAASARDVIAGIGGAQQNTATPEPPAAAAAALSRAEIQSTIRRYRSQVAGCNDGSATGTYRVSFRVQANGSVQNVSVDNGDSIGNCLVGVVSGMSFPANDGNTPPITYPFPFGS